MISLVRSSCAVIFITVDFTDRDPFADDFPSYMHSIRAGCSFNLPDCFHPSGGGGIKDLISARILEENVISSPVALRFSGQSANIVDVKIIKAVSEKIIFIYIYYEYRIFYRSINF